MITKRTVNEISSYTQTFEEGWEEYVEETETDIEEYADYLELIGDYETLGSLYDLI